MALAKIREEHSNADNYKVEEDDEEKQDLESSKFIPEEEPHVGPLPPVKPPLELRLTANHFRSLWGVVDTSGSFQCKIKFAPSINSFSDHMKRQVSILNN